MTPRSIGLQLAIAQATTFKLDNPTESSSTAARIYKVNEGSVRQRMRRRKQPQPKQHGGHNKVLSDVQIEAIRKYVEDMYLSGFGATKGMVYSAISHLRQAQYPPKEPPSWRWFQQFLKARPDLFKAVKTKPIAYNRISAQDISDVQSWFKGYKAWCEEHKIRDKDVINFDEAGFQIGVSYSEEIIVPAYITKVFSYK
jgi:hypothetical protein